MPSLTLLGQSLLSGLLIGGLYGLLGLGLGLSWGAGFAVRCPESGAPSAHFTPIGKRIANRTEEGRS